MQQVKPNPRRLGLLIFIGMLAILMLILVVAIAIVLVNNQFEAAQARGNSFLFGLSPLDRIDVDKVDPALALASLGGVPESDVIVEAIEKARPETGLSALLFNPTLNDRESAGGFLRLGRVYYNEGDQDKAVFSYQMAATIATISPNIPDTVRADVFIQASEGLIDLDQSRLTKFYLDQAFTVAAKSPFLQAPRRRDILERLQKNYMALNERELARQSLNLSANPPTIALDRPEGSVLPQPEPVLLPELIQEAEANRWQRAQELAAILVERGGQAPEETKEALRVALVEEDRQKLPYYKAELITAAQVSKKIDITIAQIEWLSIKYKVARKAYGLSLVPEWEEQVEQIRTELTKTYETLFALYADLIVALPEASQIDKATEERLRREILAGELGRYPNYPEEQRRQQLLDATNQLIITQPELNVFIGVDTIGGQTTYKLISREPGANE